MRMLWRAAVATVALSCAQLAIAEAQERSGSWPSKPVRILVGLGSGGGTDILTRIVAALQQVLANDDVRRKLERAGAIASLSAPAELAPGSRNRAAGAGSPALCGPGAIG